MLIVIEGIDGAGKTTVINKLKDHANNFKKALIFCNKKEVVRSDMRERQKLLELNQLIWDEDEFSTDPFGTYYWIKLISAWYTALESGTYNKPNGYAPKIYDGWYYRSIIKTHLREDVPLQWLFDLFYDVRVPDLVIMLDIEPTVAWERNPNKKITEIGGWDNSLPSSPKDSFVEYQSRVRQLLLRMAEEKQWVIINSGQDDSPEAIAGKIADVLRLHCDM